MPRPDGRRPDELRPVKIIRRYWEYAEGSVLIELGDTRVVCAASIEERVPQWLRGAWQGWITAEYGMIPRSTQERNPRDVHRSGGRVQEIQRLVGRSLRAAVDMEKLGERTIWIDCDVIQADGGTRTAAITGAFGALVDALHVLRCTGMLTGWPPPEFLAATSAGVAGPPRLRARRAAPPAPPSGALEVVLATRTPGKVRELLDLLRDLPLQVYTLHAFPQIRDLHEDGLTYTENAISKALAVARLTRRVAVADDSGIEIDALQGAPGPHSRRFLGEGISDTARNARILKLLADVPARSRAARYRAVVAVATPEEIGRAHV